MRILATGLLLIPIFVFGQADEARDVAKTINQLYRNSSSKFFFDIDQVPTSVWKCILQVNDSLDNVLYDEKHKSKLKGFIGNPHEAWNGTDVIINEHSPSRRFIYSVNMGTKWILAYEHGGIGHHYHVIYVDTNHIRKLTAVTSLQNSDLLRNLIWDKRIQQIRSRPFESIVNEDDFHLLNGRLLKNYDVF